MSDVVVFVIFVASLVGCVWACASLGKAIYKKIKSKRDSRNTHNGEQSEAE